MNLSEEKEKEFSELRKSLEENKNAPFKNKFEFEGSCKDMYLGAVANDVVDNISLIINGNISINLDTKEVCFLAEFFSKMCQTFAEENTNVSLLYGDEESLDKFFEEDIYLKTTVIQDEIISEPVEEFEEEESPAQPCPIEAKENLTASIDAMLFGETDSTVLEKEELKQVAEINLLSDEAETLINEIKEETFPEAPEMTSEEFNEVAKDVSADPELEYVPPTEEEIESEKKEMISEMNDYSTLHQREFADLSKLQLAADLAVSPKDLTRINSLMNDNINLIDTIQKSINDEEVGECAERWSENANEIMTIHRSYFRIGDKEVQKTLVKGVFEAFNAFSAENKIYLMKQYSEFLGEKDEEEVKSTKQEPGVPLPKSYATTGPGSVPLVGLEEDDDVQDSASIGTGPTGSYGIPTRELTEEEEEEQSGFISRMEDLENMLTGDYELAPEEVPTFEKIEEIAREHGDLAAKEYVSSLSQEQREDLARQRVAEMAAKKGSGHHLAESGVKQEPKTNTTEEVVE